MDFGYAETKETGRPPYNPADIWDRARAALLAREKAHTQAGDEIAAARRRLPMTPMDKISVMGSSGPIAQWTRTNSSVE